MTYPHEALVAPLIIKARENKGSKGLEFMKAIIREQIRRIQGMNSDEKCIEDIKHTRVNPGWQCLQKEGE